MNKNYLIALLAMFITIATIAAQPQLQEINPPLHATDYIADYEWQGNTITVLTKYKHQIMTTNDLGQTWHIQTIGAEADSLTSQDALYRFGNDSLFVCGTRQVNGGVFGGGWEELDVYSSLNGGSTWQNISPLDTMPLGLSNSFFLNSQIGLVAQTTGMGYTNVWRTQNAGQSWDMVYSTTYHNISMNLEADGTGLLLLKMDMGSSSGNTKLISTADYGATWQEMDLGSYATGSNISFLDKFADGYAYLSCSQTIGDSIAYYLLKSNDNFNSITAMPTEKQVDYLEESGRAWCWYWNMSSVFSPPSLQVSNNFGANWADFPILIYSYDPMMKVRNDSLLVYNGSTLMLITDIDGSNAVETIHTAQNRLSCFPNPTQQYINIELPTNDPYQITLYDMQGNLLRTCGRDANIDISTLPIATYILKAQNLKTNAIQTCIVLKN